MVKTALPCDFAIAQKLTSKLLYLVGSYLKTLRYVLKLKPCQNIYLADATGCASHGGLLPTCSTTAFCDVHSHIYKQNSTIINYLRYLKLIV